MNNEWELLHEWIDEIALERGLHPFQIRRAIRNIISPKARYHVLQRANKDGRKIFYVGFIDEANKGKNGKPTYFKMKSTKTDDPLLVPERIEQIIMYGEVKSGTGGSPRAPRQYRSKARRIVDSVKEILRS